MEIAPDRVVYEPLLYLRYAPRLVFKHCLIVPLLLETEVGLALRFEKLLVEQWVASQNFLLLQLPNLLHLLKLKLLSFFFSFPFQLFVFPK